MITIQCTEKEMDNILDVFVVNCPFEQGTIKDCGEDSGCIECLMDNIKFEVAGEEK